MKAVKSVFAITVVVINAILTCGLVHAGIRSTFVNVHLTRFSSESFLANAVKAVDLVKTGSVTLAVCM